MFERNAEEVQKQLLSRYAAFGVFLLVAIGVGLAIGGGLGVGVGLGIALLGSFISDVIHIGQAADNLAHNGLSSPTRSVEPQLHQQISQSRFRDAEIIRRESSASQEHSI